MANVALPLTEATVARFWSKVNKSGPVPQHAPHVGNCWVWTGWRRRGAKDYGVFSVSGSKRLIAHRVSWAIEHGSWPELYVCHRCDIPSCVRPDHLFEGTQFDNMRDMCIKGRAAAILTAEQVREILIAARAGLESQKSIASRFGINISRVSRILSGDIWRYATADVGTLQAEHMVRPSVLQTLRCVARGCDNTLALAVDLDVSRDSACARFETLLKYGYVRVARRNKAVGRFFELTDKANELMSVRCNDGHARGDAP